MGAYRFSPWLQIRRPGVELEVLERCTPTVPHALLATLRACHDELVEAARVVRKASATASASTKRKIARVLDRRLVPDELPTEYRSAFERWREANDAVAAAIAAAEQRGGRAIVDEARRVLPGYLVFASASVDGLAQELHALTAGDSLPDRHQRRLLLYLQRVSTKNETMSSYGPSQWAHLEPSGTLGEDTGGPLRRTCFVEKRAVTELVAALQRDPAARALLIPRLHPFGRLEGARFVRDDRASAEDLLPTELAIVARCDGARTAAELGELAVVDSLVARGVLDDQLHVPAGADRLQHVRARIAAWPDSPARTRWLAHVDRFTSFATQLEATVDVTERRAIVASARAAQTAIGGAVVEGQRFLYAGTNPIGEDCVVDKTLAVPERWLADLATSAAPWFEFWQRVYCTIATQAATRLRVILSQAAPSGGPATLAGFLGRANAAGLALHINGIPMLAAQAFAGVRARFATAFGEQATGSELVLDPATLEAVGGPITFTEATWPSADLQIRARSAEAIARGEHQWIIAELHPGVAVVQRGLLWGCPDLAAFSADVRTAMDGSVADFGFAAVDLTTHTTVPFVDFAPSHYTYVGPGAPPPGVRALPPSEVEVVDVDGDVRMRDRTSGRDLGSFARSWALGLGFHPFLFRIGRRTPRLVVQGVVVQRAMWTIDRDDWKPYRWLGSPPAVQPMLECERLRSFYGLPRHVFIRPSERAIMRIGAGGRDKDAKPIYIDLECPMLVRILARWIDKHGEVEITEMLPEPEMVFWRGSTGRHPFELRTLLLPG